MKSIQAHYVRDLLTLSSRFFVLSILTAIGLNIDNLIISMNAGPAAVTAYSIPARLGSVLGLLILTLFMGVAAIFYTFAGGGLTNGLIKHVSEDSSNASRSEWLSAAGLIAVASSAGLAAIAIALYFFGAEPIFSDQRLAPVFLIIGAIQLLVGIGNISIAYLSGVSDLRRFVYANGAGNILALAILIGLAYIAGIEGAYLGAAALPLVPSLLGIWYVFRFHWPKEFSLDADRSKIKRLLQFFASMLLASIAVPLAQLYMPTSNLPAIPIFRQCRTPSGITRNTNGKETIRRKETNGCIRPLLSWLKKDM